MQAKCKGLGFDALVRGSPAPPTLFTGVQEDPADQEREQVNP